DEPDVLHATTYGTGELIKDALQSGFKKLIICLGGSATNDGGAGMLQSLGMKLTDRNGKDIKRGVIGLKDLQGADRSSMIDINAEIVIASDVTNPLCGPNGSSHVYGPQKGANEEDVVVMDSLLMRFADFFSMNPTETGTGAAGGLSFALKNFLGGKIVSGARLFSEEVGLEGAIRNADIVITGEGRMDAQTCNGKGPMEVTMLAGKYNRPVYAISGSLGDGYEKCLKSGVIHIEELSDKSLDKSSALMNVKKAAERLWTKISRLRDASEVTVSL
nr:glycerate kinase [Clostridiales bacterium]